MSEQSKFENYEFTEISFEEFCEEFRRMLVDMRSDDYLSGFQEYVEREKGIDLSLSNISEEDVFKVFVRYENFMWNEFGGVHELDLPDRVIDVYCETEVMDKVQLPWFSVGVFDRELNETRKELLACRNTEDSTNHYWILSEAQSGSPDNIPEEFRSIADKLRGSLN